MPNDLYPVRWAGWQAVVELPEHIEVSNAGQIREQLLSVINRGATSLIADLTATISCDHSGAEALARAHQRADAAGTELRLVVTTQIVRRVLDISGLDRLVSIYPSLDAAITPAVVWKLVDVFQDGVALADARGSIALANTRLEEMFGYQRGELTGRPVESLIPAHLQDAHRSHRAVYARAPAARPIGAGGPLVGLRRDGTSFPAEISLSPVATAAGQFALTVIRDITEAQGLENLAGLATAAVAAEQARRGQHLLDTVITGLFGAGLSLQAAMDLSPDAARHSIAAALGHLDDIIRVVRDTAFAASGDSTLQPKPADAST